MDTVNPLPSMLLTEAVREVMQLLELQQRFNYASAHGLVCAWSEYCSNHWDDPDITACDIFEDVDVPLLYVDSNCYYARCGQYDVGCIVSAFSVGNCVCDIVDVCDSLFSGSDVSPRIVYNEVTKRFEFAVSFGDVDE